MDRIEPSTLAGALLAAPGWARVGLSAPTMRMREDAAGELARVILSEIEQVPSTPADQGQLPL